MGFKKLWLITLKRTKDKTKINSETKISLFKMLKITKRQRCRCRRASLQVHYCHQAWFLHLPHSKSVKRQIVTQDFCLSVYPLYIGILLKQLGRRPPHLVNRHILMNIVLEVGTACKNLSVVWCLLPYYHGFLYSRPVVLLTRIIQYVHFITVCNFLYRTFSCREKQEKKVAEVRKPI